MAFSDCDGDAQGLDAIEEDKEEGDEGDAGAVMSIWNMLWRGAACLGNMRAGENMVIWTWAVPTKVVVVAVLLFLRRQLVMVAPA